MLKSLDADEAILYRLKKSKAPIAFMIVFFPIWLYFGSLFLISYCQYLFLGASDVNPEEYLYYGLAGLLLFIPVAMVIFLSYARNGLMITDRRVYIRKGLTGRTHIVNLGDIKSFQHAYSIGHNKGRNNRILFYLRCGQLIKTGELFITFGSLQELLAILREKFEGRGFSGHELRLLGEQNPGAGQPVTKTNLFVMILLLMPFILALFAIANYLTNS